jgi:flagellar protein FliO/FliZ
MLTLTPRYKLFAASSLLLVLPAVSALQGATAAGAARLALGLAAAGGLALWLSRTKALTPGRFKTAPRLSVVQRVGLSARSGLALVEVDGRPYLVVHGDGFARIRPTARPRVAPPVPEAP